jgi:hypothetical protein
VIASGGAEIGRGYAGDDDDDRLQPLSLSILRLNLECRESPSRFAARDMQHRRFYDIIPPNYVLRT